MGRGPILNFLAFWVNRAKASSRILSDQMIIVLKLISTYFISLDFSQKNVNIRPESILDLELRDSQTKNADLTKQEKIVKTLLPVVSMPGDVKKVSCFGFKYFMFKEFERARICACLVAVGW